jgi:hypothetical protein
MDGAAMSQAAKDFCEGLKATVTISEADKSGALATA